MNSRDNIYDMSQPMLYVLPVLPELLLLQVVLTFVLTVVCIYDAKGMRKETYGASRGTSNIFSGHSFLTG